MKLVIIELLIFEGIIGILWLWLDHGHRLTNSPKRQLRKAKRAVDGAINDAEVRMNRAVSKNWLDDL